MTVLDHFTRLSAVPRPSKREERVVAFVMGFGESLQLDTRRDGIGNILIKKPASPEKENAPAVALQAHLDMVHQQNAGTHHDFDTEGIKLIREGDWLRADGTTLGADNGMGVAAIMAVLSNRDLVHGPIEALFTVDEETGMTGAKALRSDWLTAPYLLNLDTEEDDELCIGCAGGVDVTISGALLMEPAPAGGVALRVMIRGLSGGHSGMDIDKGLANANHLLARLLLAGEDTGLQVSRIDGGTLRNAIPREASAVVLVHDEGAFRQNLQRAADDIEREYARTDPDLAIAVTAAAVPQPILCIDQAVQPRLLRALAATPSGIYRMSPEAPGLVQTSNNLARVRVGDGAFEVLCLTRGSVDSERDHFARVIGGLYAGVGGSYELSGEYPGWSPKPGSALLDVMRGVYERRFGESPRVSVVHAGLECGIIGAKYPEMEMVSFGPNILGAHSPDERAQVSSVEKFWGYLVEALEELAGAAV